MIKTLKMGLTSAMALLTLCCALAVHAAEEVGRVVAVSPAQQGDELAVQPDGTQRVLRRGSMVLESDSLQTGPAGMLQVRFLDGTGPREGGIVSLKENTILEVTTYRFDRPAEGPDKVLLKALEGSVRSVTGAVGKADPSAFEMTTPVASIGIRGTVFEVAGRPDGSWVFALWDGGIRVSSAAGVLDLGADTQYRFARVVAGQPPQGLLAPPPQFAVPVAFSGAAASAAASVDGEDGSDEGGFGAGGSDEDDSGAGGSGGGIAGLSSEQQGEQEEQRNGPTRPAESAVDINPLTGFDDPDDVAALEQQLVNELFTLSPGERQRLQSGEETGLLMGLLPDGSIVTGRATVGDDGAALLAFELPDGREALLRSVGAPIVVERAGVTLGRIDAPNGAGVLIDNGGALQATAVSSDLTFALVENAQLADLTVNAAYAGNVGVGSGSAGDVSNLGVFFDAALDLGNGRISNGLLLVEVADGAEEYRVSFGGQVAGGEAQLSVAEGIITGFAVTGTLNVDADQSSVGGVFSSGAQGFGGSFQLQEAGNAERNVDGAFAAEKLIETGASAGPQP